MPDHFATEATAPGLTRLSLETGSGPAFEPALALHRNHGFVTGEAFADYQPSAFNQFLSSSSPPQAAAGISTVPFGGAAN